MGQTILPDSLENTIVSLSRRIADLERSRFSNRSLLVAVSPTLDGNSDFTDIQTAIDFVEDRGGGTVFLKSGTYVATADIVMKEGVVLEGESQSGTIIDFNAGAFQILVQGLVGDYMQEVGLRGFTVMDSADANGGLYCKYCNLLRIEDVVVTNSTNNGITLDSCTKVSMSRFNVTGSGSHGLELTTIAKVDIISGLLDDNADGVKLTTNADTCLLFDLRLENNSGYGINIANANCDKNTITNCFFTNNTSGTINNSGTGTITDNNQS